MGDSKSKITNFFNSPYTFSFKDLIAFAFVSMFIYATWKCLTSNGVEIEVLRVLISPIMLVLGGYFSQEVASAFFTSRNKTSNTSTEYAQNDVSTMQYDGTQDNLNGNNNSNY